MLLQRERHCVVHVSTIHNVYYLVVHNVQREAAHDQSKVERRKTS